MAECDSPPEEMSLQPFGKWRLLSISTHFGVLLVFGAVVEPTSRVEVAFAAADQGVLVG